MTAEAALVAPETLDREGGELVARVTTVTVVDTATFTEAGEMLKTVKGYLAKVAEVFDPMQKAAHDAHKAILAQRKKAEGYALEAERRLKTQMAAFQHEQERLAREAEETRRKEQERLEAEERERAAAEQRRLQAEAESERLAQAVAAEQRGDTEAATRLIEAPVVVPPPPPRPVFAPPPAVQAAPRVEGVSFREEWAYEILDATLIPREYLLVDDKKISGVVRAMRSSCQIPGVRVFSRKVAAVRG